MDRSPVLSQTTRREAILVMLLWVACCIYTCTYAYLNAYRPDAANHLIYGIPSWVVWGVFAPWGVCTLVTIWASFWGIQDEDLGEENTDGHGEEPSYG